MPQTQSKYMTLGEGGTAVAFVALAFFAIVVAAKAYTPEFAFHAYLFAAGSVAAVFAIFSRYFDRPAGPTPLTIDDKPNYNMGPVKLATILAVFWGIAGFAVGLWIALELAFPALNFDISYISFGRLRPLHTSAVIFAFGGNVLIATSFYVVQRTSRARLVGDIAPWFVVLGYNFFILDHQHRLFCSASPNRKNTPSRNGMPIFGSPSCGWFICWCFSSCLIRRQRTAHLRRQLVLSRFHSYHRRSAPRQ